MKKIVVNDGEQVLITNSKNDEKSSIVITNDGENLVTTSGESIAKNDPLAIYDQWLDVFKRNFDIFKQLLSMEQVKDKTALLFVKTRSYSDDHCELNVEISVNICLPDSLRKLVEGASISIDVKNNWTLLKYLAASVAEYYIEQSFTDDYKIDNILIHGYLRSNVLKSCCFNFIDFQSQEYNSIITKLLFNHNAGLSSQGLLDQLRAKIVLNDSKQLEQNNDQLEESKENLQYALSLKPKK